MSLDAPTSYANGSVDQMGLQDGTASNEFNITNYMVDASSDWFMKNPT